MNGWMRYFGVNVCRACVFGVVFGIALGGRMNEELMEKVGGP